MKKQKIETIYTDPLDSRAGAFFLTGNQALARAALISNIRYFASYPGSPITETADIMMQAKNHIPELHAEYSINESIAVHGAAGASWSGARAMITMKHVGMHVSLDPIAYLGYTGVVGGLVLAIGLDPGAKCSTSEFDVRLYNNSIHWIMFEPSNTKEVYEYTKHAFEISEKWKLPVLMILPGELCSQYGVLNSEHIHYHSKPLEFKKSEIYINNGAIAVKHHEDLLLKIKKVEKESNLFFKHYDQEGSESVIISSGCNFLAVNEALQMLDINNVSTIKLGMTYPLPVQLLASALKKYQTVYIAEELDGYLYFQLLSIMKRNKIDTELKSLNNDFISAGDLTMDKLIKNLSREFSVKYNLSPSIPSIKVPERPGTFCPGCPHRGVLYVIQQMCKDNDVYGGDIGCSSLPPYYSDWLTCMGSGMGIAHGVATVTKGNGRVYASMGDSTFYHCGIPIIVNALHQKTDLTLFILNNKWTAMTGHQALPHTAKQEDIIKNIVTSLGASHVWAVDAYDIKVFRKHLFDVQDLSGLKVFIVNGECNQKRLQDVSQHAVSKKISCKIIEDACHQCDRCYRILGCPAIITKNHSYSIDESICNKCCVCTQICPNSSISSIEWRKK